MIGFLLCLLIACLYKTTFIKGKTRFCEEPLKLANIIPLRGILAVEIVLGHTYGHLENDSLLYFNNRIGVWVVGIFFFLSGYGLSYSFHRKKDYLKGFLVKRVGRILFPFVIVCFLNYFLGVCGSLLECMFQDWFVVEMTLIYCVWYLLYRYLPEKYVVPIFAFLVLVLNIWGSYYGIGSRWYGSTACFLLGIAFEKNEKTIFPYCRAGYGRKIGISVAFFVFSGISFVLNENNLFANTLMINVTCILLCIIVYLFMMKITIGNVLTHFLGCISWQIYVSHRTFLKICDQIEVANDFTYMFLLFVSVIAVSYGLWFCEKKICVTKNQTYR